MNEGKFVRGELFYQMQHIPWNRTTVPVIATWVYEGLSCSSVAGSQATHSPYSYSFSLVSWYPDMEDRPETRSFFGLASASEAMLSWHELVEELSAMRQAKTSLPDAEADDSFFRSFPDGSSTEADLERVLETGALVPSQLYYEANVPSTFVPFQAVISTWVYDGLVPPPCVSSQCETSKRLHRFTPMVPVSGKWGPAPESRYYPPTDRVKTEFLSWRAFVASFDRLIDRVEQARFLEASSPREPRWKLPSDVKPLYLRGGGPSWPWQSGRAVREVYLTAKPGESADLANLAAFPEIETLVLAGRAIGDAEMPHVARLPKLRRLTLHETDIGDQGMRHLSRAQTLAQLVLLDCPVTDSGLEPLSSLHALKCLHLVGLQVSDYGMSHLANLSKLSRLSLYLSALTDSGLVHVGRLTQLNVLFLTSDQIGDAGVAELGKLSELTHLSLRCTAVGDGGIRALARLPKLQKLDLHRTQVTDDAVDSLSQIQTLKYLDVTRTHVTRGGVATLQERLSSCWIRWKR